MFHRVRRHLTPATFIALLALVFAVTGGAFAASSHGGGAPTGTGVKAIAAKPLATAAKSKGKQVRGVPAARRVRRAQPVPPARPDQRVPLAPKVKPARPVRPVRRVKKAKTAKTVKTANRA